MNIFLHELKAYRKSTIIWLLSLIAIMMLFMSLFPSFHKDAEEFTKLLEGYPESLRKAIGLDLGNLFTIMGFYTYALTFIILIGAIQAMNLGTSIVSKEVREKTADFLLTKPVTRTTVITAKLMAAFVSLVITNVIYGVATYGMASQVKTEDYSLKMFLLLSLSIFWIQLIFLAIGIVMSVMVRKIKSVLTVSLATVFSFYFIGMIGATTGDAKLRYLSPFKYFDPAEIMKHAGYDISYVITGAVIIVIAVSASYFIYAHKDIHAV
ncbi:ABC transporter permease [Paenibacillus sp. sgz5001063]|uniref:ABC transporter permease n=1 Tax=Paenibacillus sp. sgz5001063 TaxID=3242474 RepID=UPI0036D2ED0D